jgi:PAS domain S-box-containing protein
MSEPNLTVWSDSQALINVMPVGVFRIKLDSNRPFVLVNDCLCQLLSYPRPELMSLSIKDIFADPKLYQSLEARAIKESFSRIDHVEVLTKTQRSLSCRLSFVAVKADKENVVFLDGILEDISEANRVQKDLKDSKEIFQTVFNNSAVAILVADQEDRVTAWNPFVQEILGMEKIDLFNKSVSDLYPAQEWQRVFAARAKDNKPAAEIETQVYKKDGSVLDVGLSLSFIKDSEQNTIGSITILRDMTRQKIAERKIRESEAKIRIILDHSAAAITLTDEQERIISWNRFTEQMLDKTKEDLYLQPISILYPPSEWEKIRAADIRKIGSRHHFETFAVKKDGTLIDVDLSVNMLKDSNGSIVGSVGIMQDITEQKRVQQMLIKAKVAAEDANNSKSLFLANMSHEVRTPMNTILGLVDLTLDTQLSPEQRDNLNTIKNAGDILLSLLNDILDLSRVEAGKIQLENIELNIANIVQSVCKGLEVLSRHKKIELVREVDENIPASLIGDPVRIRQILVNLINNAIKFTFQGNVTTSVRMISCADGICELQFAVKDQGVGIPKDKLETIFEVFTQADASTTRRFGGTGLGLAISKRLVEMMNGRIWAESEEFQGSVFIFTAKFRIGEKAAEPVTTASEEVVAAVKEIRALRVLLAEDNVVNQKIAAKMIEKKGWTVKGAENGKQVLEYLEQEQFDVILMDAQMPVLDGFEATRLIREAEKKTGKHIPIVALTAHAMAGDRQKCLDAGMDGYVSKPIDRQKLYEAVEGVVK